MVRKESDGVRGSCVEEGRERGAGTLSEHRIRVYQTAADKAEMHKLLAAVS